MIGIYRYKIKLLYVIDNREYELDSKNILNLLIDYDYDSKNRPILFATVSIDKNILDDMIKNKGTNTITLVVSKYNTSADFIIEQNYIKSEFIYFLSDNINYQKNLDYAGVEEGTEDKFKVVNLGLMKKELIDNNKVLINDIVIDTTITDIVYNHMSHMNVLIEPFKNQKPIKRFIIPPMTTISSFIQYLDNYSSLYNSRYRLFFDHNKTYLISSDGNPVKAKDDDYFTVMINIHDTAIIESKYQGMTTDNFVDSYIIDVDANDIEVYKDKETMRSKNTIIGIDSDGNIRKGNVNSNSGLEKVQIERVTSSNLDKVDIAIDELDNTTVINVVKNDLDTSVLTINKQYNITSYTDLKENDGRYLLVRKREIYNREGNEYILTNILTMKKIDS